MKLISGVFLVFTALLPLAEGALSPLYHVGNRLQHAESKDFYLSRIQPILSSRCVACHGCYEAPCQLNLESYEGLRRGFHPTPIFHASRMAAVKPTRLFDANSEAQWRAKGFFPVVEEQNPKVSLIHQLLDQGSRNNTPGFSLAPLASLQAEVMEAKPQCTATRAQWDNVFSEPRNNLFGVKPVDTFLRDNPAAGMPFGLPRLAADEEKTLLGWIENGAPGPDKKVVEDLNVPTKPAIIDQWEAFLNGTSNKHMQVGRYIYEHVYTTHAHFDENPGEYFELVRSRTKEGAVDQIVTLLPYDAPGVSPFYYRFKKITRTLAAKTHFVWPLNKARLDHIENLFINAPEWKNSRVPVPVYGSANPFRNFASIPARARSRFLMENSRVIVGGMTQGSVCVGSTATYAIADHFWSWFLLPEADPSVTNPSLGLADIDILQTAPTPWEPSNALERAAVARLDRLSGADIDIVRTILVEHRRIHGIKLDPATEATKEELVMRLKENGIGGKEILGALNHFRHSSEANQKYQEAFERGLRKGLKAQGRDSLTLKDLWDGTGDSSHPKGNPNSWINITRHGRSATVQLGGEGGLPQSIWVMSYSNFERLYYNLVASYQEWGSSLHKMATWRHMSYVRLEGEDLAISFLPLAYRDEVRSRFTRGLAVLKNAVRFPLWSTVGMNEGRHLNPFAAWDLPPRPSSYKWGNADESIHYLVETVRQILKPIHGEPNNEGLSAERLAFEARLNKLMGRSQVKTREVFAQFLPNTAYLTLTASDGSPWVYSLNADRGYLAHNIMLAEEKSRDPKLDSLAVYRGFVGHYPNVFLEVPFAKADEFLREIATLNSAEAGKRFEAKWGIARNSDRFWPFFDWLHTFKASVSPGVDPVEQGVADLSQYDMF